jgi:hypothetical protein
MSHRRSYVSEGSGSLLIMRGPLVFIPPGVAPAVFYMSSPGNSDFSLWLRETLKKIIDFINDTVDIKQETCFQIRSDQ